jgi:putative sterol carrier protein
MTMHDDIQSMIDKFNRKVENDEKVKAEVEKIYKSVNIDLDSEHYSLIMDHGIVRDYKDELLPEADITILTTPEHMKALIDGTLRPMKAYVTKKIVLKGKIDDIMYLRKLF